MGKMKEILSKGKEAVVAILGDTDPMTISISNSTPTLCKIYFQLRSSISGPFTDEASLGQLRAAVTEFARAFNNLVDLQGIQAKKIEVDGKIPQ